MIKCRICNYHFHDLYALTRDNFDGGSNSNMNKLLHMANTLGSGGSWISCVGPIVGKFSKPGRNQVWADVYLSSGGDVKNGPLLLGHPKKRPTSIEWTKLQVRSVHDRQF